MPSMFQRFLQFLEKVMSSIRAWGRSSRLCSYSEPGAERGKRMMEARKSSPSKDQLVGALFITEGVPT